MKLNYNKEKGFTLIEAIVSLAIFAIAFSGLFLFFGMATLANNNTEKRMHLNLVANRIVESIAAESTRSDTDILNPFVTPTAYSGSLEDCTIYLPTDIRRTWCDSLNQKVGPEGSYADEERTITVVNDDTDLIVNVSLVVDGGSGANKLVSSFFTRKIRVPNRRTIPEGCVDRHNDMVAYIKSEKEKCDAGTVPFITVSRTTTTAGVLEYKLSCPDYIMSGSGFAELPGLPGNSILDPSYRTYLAMTFFQMHVLEKVWIKGDPSSTYWEGDTIYGTGYPWAAPGFGGAVAGNIWIAGPSETDTEICEDNPGINNMYLPNVKCHATWPTKPIVNVFSCCPKDTDINSSGNSAEGFQDGTYKKCQLRPQVTPHHYIPYMGDGFDFTK